MASVVWQTDWGAFADAFDRKEEPPSDSRGCYHYEYAAAMALAVKHTVFMDRESVRRVDEGSVSYWMRLRHKRQRKGIFIKAYPVVCHGASCRSAVNIGVFHHINLTERRKSLKGRLLLRIIIRKLRELEWIVCVSKHRSKFLVKAGCRNVKIIYNAFDLNEFKFDDDEVKDLLEKHNIPTGRPVVYIGVCSVQKGVLGAYRALKDQGYTLVMTGPPDPDVNIPVCRLVLNRQDYLRLLKASDVVITMSMGEEGWSRVAHEAMLCRTPVVGSGTSGMRELLEGGRQIICEKFESLPEAVREALSRKEYFGSNGYAFARDFTIERFKKEWNEFMDKVTSA